MQYKVILTKSAATDIEHIADYIAVNLRERQTALKMVRKIRETAMSLQTMPEKYPVVQDNFLALKGVRMVTINHYLMFYTVDHAKGIVSVLNVVYGKREWISFLTEQFKN